MPQLTTAVTYAEYGGPDVLTLGRVEVPEPGPGQVQVRVRATGVNPFDWKLRSGMFADGKPLGKPALIGRDVSGVIEAVGADVDGFAVGDRVAGNVNGGTSAELIVTKAADLAPLPDNVNFVTGAAVGVAGTTAIRVLGLAEVSSGDTVLIHGATGGVGIFTTQLAVGRGATVVGTTGEANLDFLRSLGATAITYGDGWEDRARAAAPDGYDAVLDLTGKGVIEGSRALVKPGVTIVTIADYGAAGPGVLLTRGGESGFENALSEVVSAVADGSVHVTIQRTFPLAEAAAAHRLSESGHVRGKIVLTLG